MALASMISTDRDAFICDMAETYHVLDINELPVPLLATLASGLREDSRIRSRLNGMQVLPVIPILAHIADSITMLIGCFAGEKPKGQMLTDLLYGKTADDKKEYMTFESGEEFLAERNRLVKKIQGN